jgi:hypothetical protein
MRGPSRFKLLNAPECFRHPVFCPLIAASNCFPVIAEISAIKRWLPKASPLFSLFLYRSVMCLQLDIIHIKTALTPSVSALAVSNMPKRLRGEARKRWAEVKGDMAEFGLIMNADKALLE